MEKPQNSKSVITELLPTKSVLDNRSSPTSLQLHHPPSWNRTRQFNLMVLDVFKDDNVNSGRFNVNRYQNDWSHGRQFSILTQSSREGTEINLLLCAIIPCDKPLLCHASICWRHFDGYHLPDEKATGCGQLSWMHMWYLTPSLMSGSLGLWNKSRLSPTSDNDNLHIRRDAVSEATKHSGVHNVGSKILQVI
jgi:hypothetical protein